MFDVMLVEDIEATSIWMETLLKQTFPDTRISFRSITETKAYLDKQPLALVLVDLNLPDGSDIDLIPATRQQN